MQINRENIKRPALYQPFFNEQLIWNSDYLEYIHTNNQSNATSLLNNTKKTIKKFVVLKCSPYVFT